MTVYIHTPPPDSKYYIVYNNDEVLIYYGELTPTSGHLGYARDNIETFDDKQTWIDRLDALNVTHQESV